MSRRDVPPALEGRVGKFIDVLYASPDTFFYRNRHDGGYKLFLYVPETDYWHFVADWHRPSPNVRTAMLELLRRLGSELDPTELAPRLSASRQM